MAAGTQLDGRWIRAFVALISLTGLPACGRFGFAPDNDDDTDTDGDAPDGAPCPAGELPDPTGRCVPALVLDESIVGYWPLDEAVGALVFRDLSGNLYDGSCGDGCPIAGQPGIRGSSVDYMGTQQGIVVGTLAELNVPMPAFTIAAWTKLRVHDTYGYILSNDRDCCGAYSGFSLWSSHYTLGPALMIWDGTEAASAQPVEFLALDAWHQVVGTYADGTASLYVDGQLVASLSRVLSMPPSYATTIGAGGYNPLSTNLENGAIDEVLVLARVLSGGEILALYDFYVAGAPP